MVGESVNSGLEVSARVPVLSAAPPVAPLMILPKNRLLVTAPLALSAPAEATPAVEPEPLAARLVEKMLLENMLLETVMPENDATALSTASPPNPLLPLPPKPPPPPCA